MRPPGLPGPRMSASQWCGSRARSSCRLRLAFQPRGATGPLFAGEIVDILELKCYFLMAAGLPAQYLFAVPAAYFELDGVAWIQPSQWLARILTGRFSLDFNNRISDFEARTLSLGASSDGLHFHRSVEIARSGEAGVCGRGCALYQAQTHAAENITPGNLFPSSDVLGEEIVQIGVTHGFGSFPHAVR